MLLKQRLFFTLLGTIPGRILTGTVIDSACTSWSTECGALGACRAYDTTQASLSMTYLISAQMVSNDFNCPWISCSRPASFRRLFVWYFKSLPFAFTNLPRITKMKIEITQRWYRELCPWNWKNERPYFYMLSSGKQRLWAKKISNTLWRVTRIWSMNECLYVTNANVNTNSSALFLRMNPKACKTTSWQPGRCYDRSSIRSKFRRQLLKIK